MTADPRFYQRLGDLAELHTRKSQDYGAEEDPYRNVRASEEFGVPAWLGAVIRLNDKVQRLKSLATKGELANESVRDSFQDIAVYAIIADILYEDEYRVTESVAAEMTGMIMNFDPRTPDACHHCSNACEVCR